MYLRQRFTFGCACHLKDLGVLFGRPLHRVYLSQAEFDRVLVLRLARGVGHKELEMKKYLNFKTKYFCLGLPFSKDNSYPLTKT